MTAKEFLKQYEEADKRVQRLNEEYEKELELIDAVRSTADYDTQPKSRSFRKTVEDKAIRLADKARQRTDARLEAIRIRREVFDVIDNVKGDEGDVLYQRYINLRKWEEICVLMNYSWAGIHKLHRRALEQIDYILNGA